MKEIKLWTRKFFQHFWQYLALLLSVSLVTELVLIPFFRLLTTFILQAGKIPFVSYQNLKILLAHHPLVCGSLILEVIAIIIIIYCKFSYLLLGIVEINSNRFNLKKIFLQIWLCLKKLKVSSVGYFILYFLLVVPIADIIYRTPLLAKIHLPQFIADYLTRNGILFTILILSYLLISYVGIHNIYFLPLIVYKNNSAKEARKKSWTSTKGKKGLKIIKQLFLIEAVSTVSTLIGYAIIICLQLCWNLLPGKLPRIFAQISLLAIQIIAFVGLCYSFIASMLMLNAKLGIVQKAMTPSHSSRKRKYFFGFLFLGELGLIFFNNSFYLQDSSIEHPLVISHRGVSKKNGVQNTLAALKKTARLKPDYVEIDLHETADNKLVVMHDENLKKLAGKNLAPHALTLKQLQKITISENGYHDKIASFDEYLEEAQKLHQKLLIEIKTTPKDSSELLNWFNKNYGKVVLKHHYQIQSLDYSVIEKLHQLNPNLFLIYIQPYNLSYPHSVADGYAMEYSTLTNDFVCQAHRQKKIVYAWTVDKPSIMKKMMYYHVEGIITDDVEKTQQTIKQFNQKNNYASQLLNYVLVFSI